MTEFSDFLISITLNKNICRKIQKKKFRKLRKKNFLKKISKKKFFLNIFFRLNGSAFCSTDLRLTVFDRKKNNDGNFDRFIVRIG